MDDTKKFEDFLDKMQGLLDNAKKRGHIIVRVEDLENAFPELKQNKDERIREELIDAIKGLWVNDALPMPLSLKRKDDWIDWLEKQTNTKVKDFSENREDLSDFYKQVCHMAASLLNKEYDYTMETIEWYAYTLLKYAKKELEKQDKKPQGKSAVEAAKEEKIDNANKVEPQFKVGDWVIWDNKISSQVIDFYLSDVYQGKESLMYTVTDTNNMTRSYSVKCFDNNAHLWTIQDAKDGDVLYSLDSNQPFIYKERNRYAQAIAYCGLNIFGKFFVWDTEDCAITLSNYVPATKEQRDLLFAKMEEAGYEWNAEKKELKKVEPKPTWSEEDEEHVNSLLQRLEGLCRKEFATTRFAINEDEDWLKSLKERVQPQSKSALEINNEVLLHVPAIEDTNKVLRDMICEYFGDGRPMDEDEINAFKKWLLSKVKKQ